MGAWLSDECRTGTVSVVIPTRDRAEMLAETLASVLAQTHESLEVVLVDDGSSDRTPQLAEEWAARFREERGWELRLHRQDHLGGGAARNRGTRESRGEFINYLDDDDLLSADKIAAQVEVARESGADLIYGPWTYFVRDGDGYGLRPPHGRAPRREREGEGAFEAWLRGWSWYVMAGMVTRTLVDRAGPWNQDLRCCQDLDFSARCLRTGPRTAHCPRGMLYRRSHKLSVANRSFADYEDSLIAFARAVEKLAFEALPEERARPALAQYLGRHAIRFFAKGSVRGASHCAGRVRELDPGYRPRESGLSTRLAYALGGFRLWARKNVWRDRLKSLSRRLRGRGEGFRRVPRLETSATSGGPADG
jgi:glycosyltransferase involved in cell wall biosynthesis